MSEPLLYSAPITVVILLVTVFFSYYALSKRRELLDEWVLHPFSMVREGKYFMLISHGFLHGNYIHLLVNMIAFVSFSAAMEPSLGPVSYFLVYFGSMVGAALYSTYKKRHWEWFRSVGASGAISGLVMSFILYYPTRTLQLLLFFPMPAWLLGIVFIGVSYYLSKKGKLAFIDHDGHIWGAISGTVITILLDPGVVERFWVQLF